MGNDYGRPRDVAGENRYAFTSHADSAFDVCFENILTTSSTSTILMIIITNIIIFMTIVFCLFMNAQKSIVESLDADHLINLQHQPEP